MAEAEGANTKTITYPHQLQPPWKPGQSGNPSGRPAGTIGLARYIRDNTLDGRELADFLIAVMRGEKGRFSKMSDQMKACELLMDRAFGKLNGLPVEEGQQIKPVLDLDKLTTQELEFLENVRSGLVAIGERVRRAEAQEKP